MSREETVTIDYWKEPEFNEDDVKGPFFEESSFQVVFPETRAKYIQQVFFPFPPLFPPLFPLWSGFMKCFL
ncbi:hypothetical protein GNI_240820 [Gregarina niphandrodes]|uniref:Uncharacterized protein n=1 Tax=Gregarina niphandrodes TaxID=110365 RepID=A0A023AWM8_GRENI|nr:hypothetical protein GNI_240820 [Gregarina niphandrodes]EZG42645.1 hypothetical protein GNI_240820 [Gregarina niphandrodes]|eukprot:XP_011134747.1 hypothetical protein GNI_240820 [Gregarina niphandrodes]